MSDDEILCHQCGKDLVMKYIELKELVFCSTSCFEQFRNSMSRRDFSSATATAQPRRAALGVPKYSNDYVKMCGYCPARLSEACRKRADLSGVYHDEFSESSSIHWCCHALFVLSSSLSDGTVPYATTRRKSNSIAEELTRKAGIKGVTPVIVSNAFADLAGNFEYKKLPEHLPEVKTLGMSHAAACLLCSPDFARQCEAQVEKEFKLAEDAKKQLHGLWCAHTVQSLAEIFIDRENGVELIGRTAPLAEQVARERAIPVSSREIYLLALGRCAPA